MTDEELIKYAAFPVPEPQDEIHVLLRKHGLVLERVECHNYPKIIGISPMYGNRVVCSLWRMSVKNSRRKIKKGIKKFLRQYDIKSTKGEH